MIIKQYKPLFEDDSLPELYLYELIFQKYKVALFTNEPDVRQILSEANKRGHIDLGGVYSAEKHKPHTTQGEYHVHIYANKNQIGAINMSGTTHDSFHGVQLPSVVVDGLKKVLPKFKIPENGLLESIDKIEPITLYYEKSIKTILYG